MRLSASAPTGPLTGAQLREAERGFLAMMRAKRFPGAWVEKNALDLLAQASSEYARWLKSHEPEESPVGWLITCAYRRALNLLDSEGRRPPITSIDVGFDLVDETAPTPEQEVLDDERQRRLREAIGCLPAKDQRLISLVYFKGASVREAGRRLGWRKSAADRHHREALQRLRSILGEDRDLLSPASVGVAAWIAFFGRGSGPAFLRRLGGAGRRLLPLAEPGGIAASGGLGRAVGVCGAGLAAGVCGLLAAGVHPALPGATSDPAPRPPARHRIEANRAPRGETPPAAKPSEAREGTRGAEKGAPPREGAAGRRSTAIAKRADPDPAGRLTAAPAPTSVVQEFGVEASPEATPDEETPSAPAPAPATSPAPSQPAHAESSAAREEFGL